MKKIMMVAAAAMMTAAGAIGQTAYFSDEARHKCSDLANAEKRYVLCLKSENAGVVQSAMAHAVNMKLICPSLEFKGLKSQIAALSATGGSPSIRYRAYLASMVFDNAEMFKYVRQAGYANPDELFNSIATRVQVTFLGEGEQGHVREK